VKKYSDSGSNSDGRMSCHSNKERCCQGLREDGECCAATGSGQQIQQISGEELKEGGPLEFPEAGDWLFRIRVDQV